MNTHNVHKAFEQFLTQIDDLTETPGNPRRGDMKAIEKALAEFGQVEPLLFVRNEEGLAEIVHGNHRHRAMKGLGWSHVAAVDVTGFSEDEIIALGLAMNRVSDLGAYDPTELLERMNQLGARSLLDAAGYSTSAVQLLELVEEKQPSFDAARHERLAENLSERVCFRVSHSTADVWRSLHLDGDDEANFLALLNTFVDHGDFNR